MGFFSFPSIRTLKPVMSVSFYLLSLSLTIFTLLKLRVIFSVSVWETTFEFVEIKLIGKVNYNVKQTLTHKPTVLFGLG